jgi:hypothetical protein
MIDEFWTHPSSFIVSGDSSLHNQSNIKRQFSKRRHVLPPASKGVNTIFFNAFLCLPSPSGTIAGRQSSPVKGKQRAP